MKVMKINFTGLNMSFHNTIFFYSVLVFLIRTAKAKATNTWLTQLTSKKDGMATILFVGDISFAGIVYTNVKRGKCQYNDSFTKIKGAFADSDFVIANLESLIGNVEKPPEPLTDKIHLLAEDKSLQALKYLGVQGVTVANNHFIDYGDDGAKSTIKALEKYKIKYSGMEVSTKYQQKGMLFEINGIKFGMLAYCLVESECLNLRSKVKMGPASVRSKGNMVTDLIRFKKRVDFLVVYLHWQNEYTSVAPRTEEVAEITTLLTPHADVIIGAHQHVTNGHFYYKNKLIAIGMGNFLFPMHYVPAARDLADGGDKTTRDEKAMYRLTKKFKNPTSYGKILKLTFNATGLVRSRTEWMKTVIDFDANNCMTVLPRSSWQTVCQGDDRQCLGDDTCNPVDCF